MLEHVIPVKATTTLDVIQPEVDSSLTADMATTKAPKHRQNRKPSRIAEERRRNLIDAAIRNISDQGYDAVTIATICEEAGFSRGLIGHYFKGKDDLLLEAVKAVAADLGRAIRESASSAGDDPEARLHALVRASFTPPGFTPEKVAVWVALAGAAHWSPNLAKIYRDIWHDYRAGIGRLLDRAAKVKKIQIDAASTAMTFSHMVEGFWVGWANDPATVTPKTAADCCHSFLELVLAKRRG